VAVKVQRPGLKKMIARDIGALKLPGKGGRKGFPESSAASTFLLWCREIRDSLGRETGFQQGSSFHRALPHRAGGCSDSWIPNVVRGAFEAAPVLTLEFSGGERVDVYARLHPKRCRKAINTLVR